MFQMKASTVWLSLLLTGKSIIQCCFEQNGKECGLFLIWHFGDKLQGLHCTTRIHFQKFNKIWNFDLFGHIMVNIRYLFGPYPMCVILSRIRGWPLQIGNNELCPVVSPKTAPKTHGNAKNECFLFHDNLRFIFFNKKHFL